MKRRLLLFGILIVFAGCYNEEIEVPDVEDITEEVMSDDVVKPEIITGGREVTASKGASAELSIVFTGRPYPDCIIEKGGKVLSFSDEYKITSSTESGGIKVSLAIKKVKRAFYGEYVFTVKNSAGSVTTTARLSPKSISDLID